MSTESVFGIDGCKKKLLVTLTVLDNDDNETEKNNDKKYKYNTKMLIPLEI